MAEKEYIEREALLDRIRGTGYAEPIKSNLLVMAVTIPAADVRPVVRGTWEEDCAGAAVCSVCNHYAFETSTHHLCGWFPNFCPNCGADMRGES